MIRAIIADDEAPVRDNIRIRLKDHPDVTVVDECSTGTETVQKVNQHQPDLLFLDIRMPGSDGFDVLKHLKGNSGLQIIFITAYDRYAVKAFEANAVDYLLKPIDSARFNEALKRTKRNLNQLPSQPAARQGETGQEHLPGRLSVKTGGKTRLIPVREISFLKADGDYVKVVLGKTGKSYLKRETMTQLADKLAPFFLRIHRSYIVNTQEITEIERTEADAWHVILAGGTKLKVGTKYKAGLDRFLRNSI